MKSIAPSLNIIRNIRRSTSIEALLDNKLITKRTYNGCKYNGYTTVGSLLSLKDYDILKWHNCGRRVLTELRTLIDAINEYYVNTAVVDINISSEDGTNRFIQLQRNIFCYTVLQEVLGGLKNYLSNESDVSIKKLQALEFLISEFDEAKDSTTHPKVISDIMDMVNIPIYKPIMERCSTQLNALSESIEQIIGQVDELIQNSGVLGQIKQTCSDIIDTISLKDRFQFLSDDEIQFCRAYQQNHSKLPKLFILYKHLVRSEERQARMLCLRYGLYADRETKSLDEIGNISQVNRERVRQLTDADGKAIKNISPKELIDEDDFSEIEFLSEQEPAIIDLVSEQNLTITPKQMIVLIDILSWRLGSTSFTKEAPTYLFSWKIWKNIDFSRLENYFKSIITQKRVKDIRLTVKDIIFNSNAFNNWYNYKYKTLKKIIICYLKDVRGIEPIDDETFLLEQTHVSDEEILEIVSEKDSIVTKDDILKECEIRFPELKVSWIENISQNPLLSSVGLKGYVPKSERGRYFSSIGDCAEAILNEYGCPLSTEFLLTEIGERGYKTNENSLRSLLLRKDDNRFARFVGDLWGLRTIKYNNYETKTHIPITKKSFTERFTELEEFISTNQRFPIYSSSEEEASMVRWIRNVQNGLIDATDEQIVMLRNLIDSNSQLPQTQFEVRFINNCLEYRSVVEFLGKRPSVTSRPQLCMWFNSNLRKENLSPNNKKAFDDLLEWLEEQGVFYGI